MLVSVEADEGDGESKSSGLIGLGGGECLLWWTPGISAEDVIGGEVDLGDKAAIE
jgi:hypothetical protein